MEVNEDDSAQSTKPLELSHLNERFLIGLWSCVRRDETAGECDHLSQRRPGVACHPLGGPPKKNDRHDNDGEQKESRAKENQENQKLA